MSRQGGVAQEQAPGSGGPLVTRRAGLPDLDAGLAALFDGYRQCQGQPADIAGARAFLFDRVDADEATILVAERDGEMVGFALLLHGFDPVACRRTGRLAALFVAPPARRSGVAAALIAAAVKHAQAAGAIGVVTAVAAANTPARALYDRLGWTPDGHQTQYGLAMR